MVSDNLVKRFGDAVEVAEGYGRPGAIPTRANNPGDLTDDGDIGLGVIHSGGPHGAAITIYPDYFTGRQCLDRKNRNIFNGASEVYLLSMSITEVGMKWAGVREWGDNAAEKLGVSPATTLAELVEQDLLEQAQANG